MEGLLDSWLGRLALLLMGWLGAQIWNKFRSRVTVLRYQIEHTYLGASQTDELFGTLKVTLNDEEYANVYLSTVALANDTGKDLKDLELNVAPDQETKVLGSYASKSSSMKWLPFADEFQQVVNQAIAGDQASATYIQTRRDYKIPVLNREENVTITLLTTNAASQQPSLAVGCDHVGVRLQQAPAVPHMYGEPQTLSTWIGIAIVFVLAWPIVILIPSKAVAVTVGLLLGIFCLGFGIVARKVYKLILKLGT